ncbi:MAG: His-Xaa-Ser system radical SAM maturase HxsB [Candidatus Altimarinota bacterium]
MINLDTIRQLRSDKIGFFRFRRLDKDTYLITNDGGQYALLTLEEFQYFIGAHINSSHPRYKELLTKGFIKDSEYSNTLSTAIQKRNHFLSYGPGLHIIIVTLRCNHKCQYCHAAAAPSSAKQFDMTEDIARSTVDTLFYSPLNDITIEFQGGEPLLNWKIVQFIIEYAITKAQKLNKKVRFALVSNMSLMDEEKLSYLMKYKVGLSTSLDGTEEIHNYNRTFLEGNSFERVTHWIKRINALYNEKHQSAGIGALLTVTKKTLSQSREVIDTYRSLGLNSIFLRVLNPYGFAAGDLEKIGYSHDEFFEFFRESLNYIIELNKAGIPFQESHSKIYLSKILTPFDPNFLDTRSPCGACIGQVAYNYNGKIYSCDEGRMLSRMGDEIFYMTEVSSDARETFTKMGECPTTKAMVQMSTLDGIPGYNESVYKPYLGVCPINSYKTTGNCIPTYSKDSKRKLDEKILDFLFVLLKEKENERIFQSWLEGSPKMDASSQCEAF